MGKSFPRKWFCFPRKYQFIERLAVFGVPDVFLTSWFNGKFPKIWAREKYKNLRHYRYSSRRCWPFPLHSKTPREERRNLSGRSYDGKFMKHGYFEDLHQSVRLTNPPNPRSFFQGRLVGFLYVLAQQRIWEVRCLVCKINFRSYVRKCLLTNHPKLFLW